MVVELKTSWFWINEPGHLRFRIHSVRSIRATLVGGPFPCRWCSNPTWEQFDYADLRPLSGIDDTSQFWPSANTGSKAERFGSQTLGSTDRPAGSEPSATGVNRLDASSPIAGGGEIRIDRVAELRRQIADGSYETPEKLNAALDRLLDHIA